MITKKINETLMLDYIDVTVVQHENKKALQISPAVWENVSIVLLEDDVLKLSELCQTQQDNQNIKIYNKFNQICYLPKNIVDLIVKWSMTEFVVPALNETTYNNNIKNKMLN